MARALADDAQAHLLAQPIHALAAGKAASAMITTLAAHPQLDLKTLLAIGTHRVAGMPASVEWHETGHPVPDERSVAAGRRAREVARAVAPDESLLLLLSGGASALMALPIDGLSLGDKQRTIDAMLLGGADIHALNTVRKHLSAIKGGRLAAACAGRTVTLAISDVVGDDLSVIGSGPGVGDLSRWDDAARALARYGQPVPAVSRLLARGVAGEIAETPAPGDPALARTQATVIASRRHALAAAGARATALGYEVVVLDDAITGEARVAAPAWLGRMRELVVGAGHPVCALSAGETTVRVTGRGRGGRNQEFALALADALSDMPIDAVAASVGTDGIDGPTDAAGALVDRTTGQRAEVQGLRAATFLDENDAYAFFAVLGDLIHLGRTDTNVGDVQVLLTGSAR